MENLAIARVLHEIADLLELKAENPFKIRAYRSGADIAAETGERLAAMDEAQLRGIAGIGKDLAARIREIAATGGCAYHTELLQEFPPTILDLLRLQGLGPKTVALLYKTLNIKTIDELEAAATAGALRSIKGMGAKKEQSILKSIADQKQHVGRHLGADAAQVAEALLAWLREQATPLTPGQPVQIDLVGSLRRGAETTGDIDILACGAAPEIMQAFTSYKLVERVLGQGPTKSSVLLWKGFQADLRLVPVESRGAALQYFTGSKAHNIAVRQRALDRGLTLNEYGLFHLPEEAAEAGAVGGGVAADTATGTVVAVMEGGNADAGGSASAPAPAAGGGSVTGPMSATASAAGQAVGQTIAAEPGKVKPATPAIWGPRVAGETEEEIYEALGLAWIDPALRENRGEIAAAEARVLPRLITHADLRGDLHMHTTETDGKDEIETMARAARALGLEYIAITDHSQALAMANGLDETRALAHAARIREMNGRIEGLTLLAGIECDIRPDGTMDLADDCLAQLDIVIASVHSAFNQEPAQMTDRMLRAVSNPHVDVIGHPTGRLILRREPYKLDVEALIAAAAAAGVALEINSQLDRLDLNDSYARLAKQRGVTLLISSDAHSQHAFDYLHWGIRTARRAWLEPADVLNTRPLEAFRRGLRRNRRPA